MMVFLANARTLAMNHAKIRIPLIKFRYGYNKLAAGHQQAPSPSTPQQQQPVQSTPAVAVDELDLPTRFHRQIISEEEIAYINNGGPV